MQHAGTTVDGPRSFKHLIGNRRSKNRAGAGCIEHTASDKSSVHWLVTAATTGNNTDLSLHRSSFTDDNLLLDIHANQVCVGSSHTLQFLFDDIFRFVDEFFHGILSPPNIIERPPAKMFRQLAALLWQPEKMLLYILAVWVTSQAEPP